MRKRQSFYRNFALGYPHNVNILACLCMYVVVVVINMLFLIIAEIDGMRQGPMCVVRIVI